MRKAHQVVLLLLTTLGLGLVACDGVQALELGRPYGRIGWDLGYDDHVSGHEIPDPTLYAQGNTDGSSALSLGLGADLDFDANRILTVTTQLKGYRYLTYSAFSRPWASLNAELATYHLLGDLDGFWSLNAGGNMSTESTGGGTLGLEHPLFLGLVGAFNLGAYRLFADTTSNHLGLWSELALRRRFGPLTLSLSYTLTRRAYDAGTVDRVQGATLYASWRVLEGVYLKTSVERDWTTSSDRTRDYTGNLANLGSVVFAF